MALEVEVEEEEGDDDAVVVVVAKEPRSWSKASGTGCASLETNWWAKSAGGERSVSVNKHRHGSPAILDGD